MITAQYDLYTAVHTSFFFQPLRRSEYAIFFITFLITFFITLLIISLYLLISVTFWERERAEYLVSIPWHLHHFLLFFTYFTQFRDTYTAAAPSSFSTSTPQWIRHLFITFITFTHHFTLFIAVGRFLLFFTYFTHHFTCFCLQVDSNNNSLIERAELRAAVARRLGKDPSDQLLDAMVAALDDNGFCSILFFYFLGGQAFRPASWRHGGCASRQYFFVF